MKAEGFASSKPEAPNYKHQAPNKLQITSTKRLRVEI
jgi:hypothetical protein